MQLRRFFGLIRRKIAAHSSPLEMWRGFAALALHSIPLAGTRSCAPEIEHALPHAERLTKLSFLCPVLDRMRTRV
jgi:hypothetical protein